jgi:hypothetical protein
MSSSNTWAEFAGVFRQTRMAFLQRENAQAVRAVSQRSTTRLAPRQPERISGAFPRALGLPFSKP